MGKRPSKLVHVSTSTHLKLELELHIGHPRITYNATLSACAKRGAWRWAGELLRKLGTAHLEPDEVTLNSILSAWEKGKQWTWAISKLPTLAETPYNVALGACHSASAWRQAELLVRTGTDPVQMSLAVEVFGRGQVSSLTSSLYGLQRGSCLELRGALGPKMESSGVWARVSW